MFTDIPPRNTNSVVYSPVNRCIYCGRIDGDLTDEHIIPFSLGGVLILPKASCKPCAKITGAFEGAVARSLFGNFRIRYKLPTRRKKERPTHIEIDRLDGGKIHIPAGEYPAPTVMYKCSRAGILEGFPPSVDTSSLWQLVVLSSDEEMKAFHTKYGKDVTFKFRHVPEQFARTIAKIGHAYAVAFFGMEMFRPLAVDLILGRSQNLSYVVGGSLDILPPVPHAGHLLELQIVTDLKKALVIVDLRLFASNSTPHYHVVVGESKDEETTRKLIKMCQPVV